MTNPLSSYGYSDDDYKEAIGMMVGESSNRSTGQTLLHEMAGQLDVALNRQGSHLSGGRTFGKGAGPTLTNVILSPSQFDAATKTKGRAHREQYSPAKRAALDDEYLATLTPNMQSRVLAAREAALKTAGTKELRGISKNATTTSSTAYKLSGKRAQEHNKEGRKTATKIGGTSFYGKGHDRKRSQEQAAAISTKLDQRASTSAPRADTPKERNLGGMVDSRPRDYSQFGPLGTPKEAIAPTAAPYSPANLDFGPDFSSPPSQARGPVENPYGFSNIDTAREAVPGTFAGFGPNAFGALDQPVDYGTTYPELGAGLYPDIAPPDVPPVPDIMGQFDPTNMMTEQQAIENANLEGQRLSENVSIQNRPYGESIDQQVARNAAAAEELDFLAASTAERMAPFGVRDNPAAYTTNPYEIPSGPMPDRFNAGIWGGQGRFNDTYNATNRATPTFVDYENRAPLAGLGLGPMGSAGPVGMAKAGGVELQRDISGISSGMYPYEAVFEAVRNAPTTPQTFAGAPPAAPGYAIGTGAQLGVPDFAAASALDREAAYQADVAAMRDPAATQARGAWADQAEVGPRPAGPDPTPFQGGLYGDPATPAGGFTPGLDYSQPVGPSPDRFSGGPAETAFSERISDSLRPGPAAPAELSAFQNTPLGLGQGIIDQGPYSSPIGGLSTSFSPANLGNPMPNSTAVATQAPAAPEIIGYEPGKAITRDVPNPAWSEWSKDYAAANASQNAWAAADEDKRAWDRAPPNPNVLADTQWAGLGKEPAKTTPVTTVAAPTPIYSKPEVVAQPVSVPAIQAQPARVAAAPVSAAQPLARTVSTPAVGVGGWWDSITSGLGNVLSGMSLADMGAGYGAFGGAYDPGGYGGGGFGGTAPGDAGYGSDARSGAGNMGAGNLYQ